MVFHYRRGLPTITPMFLFLRGCKSESVDALCPAVVFVLFCLSLSKKGGKSDTRLYSGHIQNLVGAAVLRQSLNSATLAPCQVQHFLPHFSGELCWVLDTNDLTFVRSCECFLCVQLV